jgi:hypothetical protein
VPRNQTVGAVLIRELGMRRATVIAAYISLWSLYRATEGGNDPATVEEFADAIQRDRASVFRWQSDFRQVFPQWADPGELLDAAGIESVVNARGALGLAVAS